MTHFVTDNCNNCGECQQACPVDCIRKGDSKEWPTHYIDPETCINCGACAPECPLEEGAIKSDKDKLTEKDKKDLEKNAAFFSQGPGYEADGESV